MLHEAIREVDAPDGDPAVSDATTERILAGALGQLEDFGLRRMTMEDVANRAGVSRVTIYRRFSGRDALVEAVLLREASSFLAELDAAVTRYETIEDRLAEGFAFALELVRKHTLLGRLLSTEPESLLPHLTVRASPIIDLGRRFIAGHLSEAVDEGRLPPLDVELAGEMLVRLVLSFLLAPDTVASLATPAEARRFARRYLAPALTAVAHDPHPASPVAHDPHTAGPVAHDPHPAGT